MNTVESWEVSIPLGIIVEKRKSTHIWADWNWTPVGVIVKADPHADWEELRRDDNHICYLAATLFLELHRKDTEALQINLMLPEPELYVVLQENEDHKSEYPFVPHVVTASSYQMQDYMEAGDDIVEKVAMPEAVAALIQAFVEEHHVDEKFIKRRRDKLDLEEQKFGKTPIFAPHPKVQ